MSVIWNTLCTDCVYMESVEGNEFPGASLNGRSPEELKVPKLKFWLTYRGAPTKGKKADLTER